MLAWHFCAARNGAPILRDGRLLKVGRWYVHEGPLVLCESGYHASTRAVNACDYAPGLWVCLVEVAGEMFFDSDKLVARRRRALWCYDATAVLRNFVLDQARSVLHLWDAPQAVRDYLETGDEQLRIAAWDAADVRSAEEAASAAANAAVADVALPDAVNAALTDAAWAAVGDYKGARATEVVAEAVSTAVAQLEGMLLSEAAALGLDS